MAEPKSIETLRILVASNKAHFKAQSERLTELRQSDPSNLSDLDKNALSDWDRSVVANCERQLLFLDDVKEPTAAQRAVMKELNQLIMLGDHIIEQKNLFWTELNDRRNAVKKAGNAKSRSIDGSKTESISKSLQIETYESASGIGTNHISNITNNATTPNDATVPVSNSSDRIAAPAVESDSTEGTRIVDPKQLYKVLQVDPSASLVEIKKAAKKAMLRLHPDRNPDDLSAASRFADFQAACQVFDSEQKRQEFDATGDVKAIDDL